MSLKNLFGDSGQELSHGTNTVVPLTSLSGVAVSGGVESPRLMQAKAAYNSRYVPQIDFSSCSNWAVYGSATEYYNNAAYHIYATYPYDGSKAEKLEWHNSSSDLENYIFEIDYPRTNGYAKFSPTGWGATAATVNNVGLPDTVEYIQFKGGPHTSTRKPGQGVTGSTEFPGDYKSGYANTYSTGSNRASNLQLDFDKGATVEFWLKKRTAHAAAGAETVFDVWNGDETASSYGRVMIYVSAFGDTNQGKLIINACSGSTSVEYTTPTPVLDVDWHHYAFVLKNNSPNFEIEYYRDGVYVETGKTVATLGEIGGSLIANIGALRRPGGGQSDIAALSAANSVDGFGKLSGSLDEFRFWKTARDAQQIGRNYWSPVHGATNEDTENDSNLGVYYKFNEGITGTESIDSVVLDYAGRITNGIWKVSNTDTSASLYNGTTYRSTNSAIVESGVTTSEFKDPILYPEHADIQTYLSDTAYSASFYDDQNGNWLYNNIPSWVIEEDEESGGELKKLCQIMGSYLDTLHMQIQQLPKIKHVAYSEDVDNAKPLPFMKQMLAGVGFNAPDLFTEATALQHYMDRDENFVFEESLSDIKNLIYRNIYNNLTYIYKTKGTEKSFRNLIRCFGIDDEIYKLNIYGSNVTYELRDRYTTSATKQNYLDFYETSWPAPSITPKTAATAYLTGAAIPGLVAASGLPTSYECEVKFPRKIRADEDIFVPYNDLTASIFGVKSVASDDAFEEITASEPFRVWIEKQGQPGTQAPPAESEDVRFYCSGSAFGVLTSSIYQDTYNGEEWLLSVSFETDKLMDLYLDSDVEAVGLVRFRGVNTAGDYVANFFEVTGAASQEDWASYQILKKRPWTGARRTNFDGTLEQQTDVRIGSMRGYLAALTNDELKSHGRDARNQGTTRPSRQAFFNETMASKGSHYIPTADTLIYSWDFETVTTAGADTRFEIPDISSGSLSTSKYPATEAVHGGLSLDNILSRKFEGTGYGFKANTTAVDRNYVLSGRLQPPEIVASSDQISILERDDIQFTRTTRPTNTTAYLEKSMYQTVSENMLTMFAGITEFNDLIGAPIHKYRQQYKGLELLRRIYFEKVDNEPDLEKFINYYRWIDDSVSQVLRQVLPMSADVSDKVSNVVESHVLERNKYWNKFPTMEFKQDDPEGALRGIQEMRYPWKEGYADDSNNYWKLNRENKSDPSREAVRKAKTTQISGALPTLSGSTGAYEGGAYARRSLSRPYQLSAGDASIPIGCYVDKQTDLGKAPKLYNRRGSSQIFGYHRSVLKFNEPNTYIEIDYHQEPYFKVVEEKAQDLENEERRLVTRAKTWVDGNTHDDLPGNMKSNMVMPFTVYSSSVDTGYQSAYRIEGVQTFDFNDLHHDRSGYPFHEGTPLQSPFTEKNVGGLQYRHQDLNHSGSEHGLNDAPHRAEGWKLRVPGESALSVTSLLNENFSSPIADLVSSGWVKGAWIHDPTGQPTPSPDTGPNEDEGSSADGGYIYVDRSEVDAATEVYLITPVIDGSEASHLVESLPFGTGLSGSFYYHMFGQDCGKLELEIFNGPSPLNLDAAELISSVGWTTIPATYNSVAADYLIGSQQAAATEAWRKATFDLSTWIGQQFHLRLKYTTGIVNVLGDVAIDTFSIGEYDLADFRLCDAAYLSAHHPRATYYRDETSKRPLNIKNIKQRPSASTTVGNYMHEYEIVQTSDASINNFWFKKNEGFPSTPSSWTETQHVLTSSFIRPFSGSLPRIDPRTSGSDFYNTLTIADRTTMPTTHRNINKSIFVERFASPGDYWTMGQGRKDLASEQFAPNNALPWRNHNVRSTHADGLSAHLEDGASKGFYHSPSYYEDSLPQLQDGSGHAFEGETYAYYTGYTTAFDMNLVAASTNKWSSAITSLPFDFWLGGTLFPAGSGWCASKNGLITFDTDVAGTSVDTSLNLNTALPHADIPDNTIVAFWDAWDHLNSTNDKLLTKTVGSAPYRQYVIKGFSITIDEDESQDGADDSNYMYWACILEETTNNIFFVEMYAVGHNGSQDATLGVQYTSTQYQQHPDSPAIEFGSTDGSLSEWNHHAFTHKGITSPNHKDQKNPSYSPKYIGAGSWSDNGANEGLYTIETDYNNAYVTSLIPQSERQYKWINDSVLYPSEYNPEHFPLGYFDGEDLELRGDEAQFVSESDVENPDGVKVDFVGMNSILYQELDVTTNTLGNITDSGLTGVDPADRLSAGLLHRNGPYGWPTWKQWRHNDHPLIKYKRKNNIIDFYGKTLEKLDQQAGPHLRMKEKIDFSPYSESCVVGRYKPLSHLLSTAHPDKMKNHHKIALRHSYGNNLCTFSNVELNQKLNFDRSSEEQIFDTLYDMYGDLEDSSESPVKAFLKFKYKEVVFPSELNMYRMKVRGRPEYDETSGSAELASEDYRTVWRDEPVNRRRPDNSLTIFGDDVLSVYSQPESVWTTDVAELEVGVLCGELIHEGIVMESNGTQFSGVDQGKSQIGFVQNQTRMLLYGDFGNSSGSHHRAIVAKLPLNTVHDIAARGPHADSYDSWQDEVRAIGQGYSILPEFKISEHIEYYVDDHGGDFFAQNRKFLTLPGASQHTASAESERSSRDWEFYADYSNSDFMKFFGFFEESHEGIGEVSRVSLTCRGIKKLLPYKGFYPQDRALQLGRLFKKSHEDHLTGYAGGTRAQNKRVRLNSIMMPILSPGVLLNSMKSGIAVDFPVWADRSAAPSRHGAGGTNLVYEESPDYRIPFEASVDMTRWFPKSSTKTDGIDTIFSHQTQTGYGGWNGISSPLYSMAAHNFVAEVPRFFLERQGLTSFVSKQTEEQRPMMSGTVYFMDVALSMTNDMITTEGPRYSAYNGDEYGVRGSAYGVALSGAVSQSAYAAGGSGSLPIPYVGLSTTGSSTYTNITDPNYCAWTPPYFYGKSIARVRFAPHEYAVMDEGSSAVFELQEILANCDIEYRNSNPLKQAMSASNETPEYPFDGLLSGSWMNITASVNILDKFKPPAVTTDVLGNITSMSQVMVEGLDVWRIASKWECPLLNYSASHTVAPSIFNDAGSNVEVNSGTYRALWNTYGTVPSGSTGVWLSVEESFPKEILKRGTLAGSRASSGLQFFADPFLTGSLLEFAGMESGKKRIGEVAQQREISEAVVVVPYLPGTSTKASQSGNPITWNDSVQKNLFAINKMSYMMQNLHKKTSENNVALPAGLVYPNAPEIKNTTITDLHERMKKYYIPPQLNFIENLSIDPFVMYIFEFTHTLSKQDLANIWQGILPDVGVSAQREDTIISHATNAYEFFEGKPIPPQVRWMVFKVKQKAETNYYDVQEERSTMGVLANKIKELDNSDEVRSFNFGVGRKKPKYTYNWPHDFYSLVEMIQLESEILIEPKENE